MPVQLHGLVRRRHNAFEEVHKQGAVDASAESLKQPRREQVAEGHVVEDPTQPGHNGGRLHHPALSKRSLALADADDGDNHGDQEPDGENAAHEHKACAPVRDVASISAGHQALAEGLVLLHIGSGTEHGPEASSAPATLPSEAALHVSSRRRACLQEPKGGQQGGQSGVTPMCRSGTLLLEGAATVAGEAEADPLHLRLANLAVDAAQEGPLPALGQARHQRRQRHCAHNAQSVTEGGDKEDSQALVAVLRKFCRKGIVGDACEGTRQEKERVGNTEIDRELCPLSIRRAHEEPKAD
mmetsp:Transcript_63203/g.135742  ORF Transcript_63203/g.135742 Transcript_63203/m.135742 type:complete len:298 (+) Transcript_63203:2250-3143(+)